MRKWAVKSKPGEFLAGSCVRCCNCIKLASPFANGSPITLAELRHFDGTGDVSLYFGCRGRVFDASASEVFRKSYSQWAGQDATYALAVMSLNPKDSSRTDRWLDADLTKDQLETLESWERYFSELYPIRGRVVEYDTARARAEAASSSP
jgi:predicted heme/steroid binding protein